MENSRFLLTQMKSHKILRQRAETPVEKTPRMIKKKKLLRLWVEQDFFYRAVAILGRDRNWYLLEPQFCGTKGCESTPIPDSEGEKILANAKPYRDYLATNFEPRFF